MMKTTLLGMLAETSIHCGSGRSAGIVDLPVAREAATDYPFVPGSSLKGALRDRVERGGSGGEGAEAPEPARKERADKLFGQPDQAGRVLLSDARLVLLPVRSLEGTYRWVTCPMVIERYVRDLARCGVKAAVPKLVVPGGEAAGALARGSGGLHLEERELAIAGPVPAELIAELGKLIRHEATRARLAAQLVVVGDDEFAWFCRYAVPLQARNVLEDDTKRSANLWYEESLPPDTVLYALAIARDGDAAAEIARWFTDDVYLQIGGNETVGHGWLAAAVRAGGAA